LDEIMADIQSDHSFNLDN